MTDLRNVVRLYKERGVNLGTLSRRATILTKLIRRTTLAQCGKPIAITGPPFNLKEGGGGGVFFK